MTQAGAVIFDARPCMLGEGALWHPMRKQLFWFDILGKKLLSRQDDLALHWDFADMVSAAGWLDNNRLLLASARALFVFDLQSGAQTHLAALEADMPNTRSNDGRADPMGGFWIGTMGLNAEVGAGAIYRYYRGELHKIFAGITIPNAICFAPNGRCAHFTDTVTGQVMRVALDTQGWPQGKPEVYLNFAGQDFGPDGAVIDAHGHMWLAQWGAGRVACYDAAGQYLRHIEIGAPHSSCPAFGGADMSTLFCTTALQGMDSAARAAHPHAGQTFAAQGVGKGQLEHQVIL
jgi:sugar lactone lactonase YvrE